MLAYAGVNAMHEGRRAEAEEKLQQLERLRQTQYVEPFFGAYLCAALGDHEALMRWLRRAYEERSTLFLYAPLYTWLYGDDRKARAYLERPH